MLQDYKPMCNECQQETLIQIFLCENLPRLKQKTSNLGGTYLAAYSSI